MIVKFYVFGTLMETLIGSNVRAAWLLQYIFICWISQKSNGWRNCFTHISPQMRDVITQVFLQLRDY